MVSRVLDKKIDLMTTKLLSVIIPVYNVALYLSRCLDSVLGQDYTHLEVILVNDGSTDSSLEICREFAERDNRVKVFSQENFGRSVARNVGLSVASGELISFIDSDDCIGPGTFSSAIELLEKETGCDIVQISVYHGRSDEEARLVAPSVLPVMGVENMLDECLLKQTISWIVCDKIVKREVLEGIRFLEGVRYEDNLFLFELLTRARGICFSTTGYYFYFWNAHSTTHSCSPKPSLWDDMIKVHKLIYQLVSQVLPQSAAQASLLYIITQDMYASYRSNRWRRNSVSNAGLGTLREARIGDFLFVSKLDMRKRLKMLGLKIWAHIAQ